MNTALAAQRVWSAALALDAALIDLNVELLAENANRLLAIQKTVAAYFDLPTYAMTARYRGQEVATARQVAMYFCRLLTEASLSAIGSAFQRDHGTVIHACHAIVDRQESDRAFAAQLKALSEILNPQ